MEFPYTFFEDEVREGFYVSGSIKRAWAAQLEVLAEIDKVCKKYNIRWFADCGTLLGAVRHGGYIPWDDDLDICMLREDYIRFNEVAEKELPQDYVVLNLHKEEHYFEYLTRVASGHRLNFDKEFLEKYHNSPFACGIDIFPLDYISDDEEEEAQRKELTYVVMATAENIKADDSNVAEYKEVIGEIEELCDVKIDYSKSVKQQLFQTAEMLFALYSEKKGKHVVLMPYWIYFNNHKYPAEYFDKTIMIPFEVTELPVPAAYDGVLSIEYGDYMKISRAGGVHNYPFFTGQEDHLKNLIDNYLFEYKFDKKDIADVERAQSKGAKGELPDFIALISKANVALINGLLEGAYDGCVMLLESCQNSAIQIGNLIEKDYGEGHVTVSVLEEYCELLYEISQIIVQQELNEQIIGVIAATLQEIYEKISNIMSEKILCRKEILFLPFRECYWSSMKREWEKAMADPDTDVYVVPIPYFERSATGAPTDMHYEGDLFPKEVKITHYDNYDVERRHPDKIFIQNGYDECNYTTTVPSKFYARNLKPYTDELIYIPYFVMDEIENDNKKGFFTLNYFCKIPGVILADRVIVQSEKMKERYVDFLVELAGDETREIWQNKISGTGASRIDVEIEAKNQERKELMEQLSEEWKKRIFKPDGTAKKIILCCVGTSAYTQHGKRMSLKQRDVFGEISKVQEDVVLIYRPYLGLTEMIESADISIKKSYSRLMSEFSGSEFLIFDEETPIDKLVAICDAYYGEGGYVARKCSYAGKPTMIMEPALI